MGAFEIYCNFVAAKSKANELENIARKLKSLSDNNLNHTLADLDKFWNGDAHHAYISKGRKLQQKIKQEADSLQNDADTIRRIAQRTYDTEMKALELSKQRSYH